MCVSVYEKEREREREEIIPFYWVFQHRNQPAESQEQSLWLAQHIQQPVEYRLQNHFYQDILDRMEKTSTEIRTHSLTKKEGFQYHDTI